MQSTRTPSLLTLGRASTLVLFASLTLFACGKDDDNNKTDSPTDMGSTTDMPVADMPADMTVDTPDSTVDTPDSPADMPVVADGTARVQVLHLADGAGTVDVYANGALLLDDVEEKQGTNFFPVPAGVDLTLDVVAGTATDNSSPVYTVTLTGGLVKDTNYIVAATGDVASTDEATKFRLVPIGGAQLPEATPGTTVSAMIFHGVDDAPAVDVVLEPGFAGETAIDNLAFGGFTGDGTAATYLDINPADITFGGVALANINVAESDDYVASFQTPDLNALVGQKVVIAATGSLADGTFGLTAFLGLPGETPTATAGIPLSAAARLQVVHNSADPGAAVVDVYGNSLKLIDDFAFRTATPFITVPSGADIDLNIAGPDSENDDAPVFDGPTVKLVAGSTSIVIASGVVGGAGEAAFELLVTPGQEKLADPAQIATKVHHGSPDTVPVGVRAEGADANIIDSFTYKDFVGYVDISADTNTVLEIINPAAGDAAVVKTGAAIDFGGFSTPVLVIASGSSGLIPDVFGIGGVVPGIALIAVLPDGTVVTVPLVAAVD